MVRKRQPWTPDQIKESIKDIMVDQLGVDADEVTLRADLYDDLGADSLDSVELVMALEEKFGIEINDDTAEDVRTMQGAIDLVNQYLNQP